ncbi:SIS domain-containing protein [Pseudactinotalea sp. HY160]|nr:SIS domain-containing protein [Pseudactinotalea sp. HY160]QGH71094.1 SIS domain-containing protein [Pseudactinotalea sp. HY158]
MEAELMSQPDTWARAVELASDHADLFPTAGQRVAAIGCGTSWFMAQSYAALRERAGLGETDAFVGSEPLLERDYDLVVAISRSGTTSEIITAMSAIAGRIPVLAIVGAADTPIGRAADRVIETPFADETSVVQTRFATTALTLLRASLGEDLGAAIADARTATTAPLPEAAVTAEQTTFVGLGWTIGLAHEAALKNREASQSWTESYPAMDYRHGPIAIAAPGRVTWSFGAAPEGLAAQVSATGATFVEHAELDPLADLVIAQRVALARARAAGLDPDHPRGLTRSVVLDG